MASASPSFQPITTFPQPIPPPAPPGLVWSASLHHAHFYRIPKTGSTLLLEMFRACQCRNLIVHDHSDGCSDLKWCNGSYIDHLQKAKEPAFVVLRHVCDRFLSQHDHMRYVNRGRFGQMSLHSFAMLLQNWTSHCPAGSDGVHCRVNAINRVYYRHDRVILWPQALWGTLNPRVDL